jgi:hypothetical protein
MFFVIFMIFVVSFSCLILHPLNRNFVSCDIIAQKVQDKEVL